MTEYFQKVYAQLLRYLVFRDRTEHELKAKLNEVVAKLEASASEQELVKQQVFEELKQQGYVNDKRFVQLYIQSKLNATKPPGRRLLAQQLIQKGISKQLTQTVLATLDPEVEETAVTKLFEKKHKAMGHPFDLPSKSKLIKYLLGRGCSPTLVYRVVDSKFKVK